MKKHPIDQKNIKLVLQKLVERLEDGEDMYQKYQDAFTDRQSSYRSPIIDNRSRVRPRDSLVLDNIGTESKVVI